MPRHHLGSTFFCFVRFAAGYRAPRAVFAALLGIAGLQAEAALTTTLAIPASCQRPALVPSCTSAAGQPLTGRFVSRNRGPWEAYAFGTPLHVAPSQTLAIAICNDNNHAVDRSHWPALRSLIPTLVASVGTDASLAVLIDNSANISIGNELVLGAQTIAPDGTLSAPSTDVEAALVGKVLFGTIGNGARIDVKIRDSANVAMTAAQSHLHIGGGSLIEQVLQSSAGDNAASASAACVNIDLERSSRVLGDRGLLTIGGGQLNREMVNHGLVNSQVTVRQTDTANVAAAQVRVFQGELVDEIVDVGALVGDRIGVQLRNVGNVRDGSLQIDDGELIDEVVDATQVSGSMIEVALTDAGNAVLSGDLQIHEGELIDEVVDVAEVDQSLIDVRLLRSGNVTARNAHIVEGELIDEAVDTIQLVDSDVKVRFSNSANVNAQRLVISQGELIDEMLDAAGPLLRTRVEIAVADTANLQVDALDITDGGLIDEVLDTLAVTDVDTRITIERSANVQGLGAAPSRSVAILRGDLLDEVFDIGESATRLTSRVAVSQTGNVKSRSIVLTDSRLVSELLDAPTVQASSIDLAALQSANASFTDSFTLNGSSVLLDPVANIGRIDGASRLAKSVVASGQRTRAGL